MGNDAPNAGESYGEGIQAYLKHLPKLLAAEQNARERYDPQRVEQNLALYETYDPNFLRTREAMGRNVLAGVENGYALPDDFKRELEQDIRGSQAARGNILGNAPMSAEVVYKGKNAIDLYNRNLANAGTFLSMPSPAMPDRSPGYTAGGIATAGGLGQQAFQAALNQPNQWANALSGAAAGASAGSSVGGGWGALIGGIAGGAGGYFSDSRLKENIQPTGESTQDGIPLMTFNYRGCPTRYKGVIAQDVQKVKPEAIWTMPIGYLAVNYEMLGIEMKRA